MTALQRAITEIRGNEHQLRAFAAVGNCVVLAPPGSGKTKLLTTKLAHVLTSAALRGPQGAACITMTNEAALELRRRLRALGVHAKPNLFVGTVHSFALSRILRPFASAAGRPDLASARLASSRESQIAFDAACDALALPSDDRLQLKATCERARQRLDLSGDFRLGGPRVAAIAGQIQRELEGRGLFDFYDLVRHSVDLVEGQSWVREMLSLTFPYVFVDEYQDLAPGLDRIVRAIAFEPSSGGSTLFAVGDPDQSIYGFSGAHPQLLRELADEPTVTNVSLERNYRSGQEIIDAALKALGEVRSVVGEHSGGTVSVFPVAGAEGPQVAATVALVKRSLERGCRPEEIAVLASWGADRDRLAVALREAGIAAFSRADDHWRTTPFTMLLERMAAWTSMAVRDFTQLSELLDEFARLTASGGHHEAQRAATATLIAALPSERAEHLVTAILEVVAGQSDKDNLSEEDSKEVRRMRRALRAGGPEGDLTVGQLGERARSEGRVLTATVHASKGLEFDDVIVFGADNASMYGFSPSVDEIAEARRKFYVAITRARLNVMVVHGSQRTSRRGTTYGVNPTPFLAELGL